MTRHSLWLLGVPAALGCQGILGLSQDTVVDVQADAAATADGDVDGAAEYSGLSSMQNWSFFDTTTVSSGAQDFFGGTFDGRYVYFAPASSSQLVTRYDTTGAFGQSSSWSTFSVGQLKAGGTPTTGGAAFDGEHVYFLSGSVVSAYDTFSSFGDTGSWAVFDVTTLATTPGTKWAFVGATFDGRFLYLAPSDGTVVAQFDTTQDLTSSLSWSTFDAASAGVSFGASTGAYQGSVFDGRFVYMVPSGTLPVLRYNAEINFADQAAWSVFSPAAIESGAKAFRGGAYDGRYVYLAPSGTSLVAQYDTTASFSSQHSWSVFDTTTVNANAAGFGGSAFDGRYIYLVPAATTSIARYDTTSAFTESTAWEVFDTKSVSNTSEPFAGAVFDGRYLYLVPSSGGGVVRFDARTPTSIPSLPELSGSFL